MNLDPPLTGSLLKERLSQEITHEPLIDGLLYRHASLMIYAHPAAGKSVVSLQAALQLCSGFPVFGGLAVSKPRKVWYIQMERPDIESLERIKFMMDSVQINYDNFFLDTELQKLNFLNESHLARILARGKEISADVAFIDPLYGIATGLSRDEIASNLVKTLTILKSTLGITLWINHHVVKDSYGQGGKIERDDPFYGSQWLKAHVTGAYNIEKSKVGTVWTCKKDSHSNLLKSLELAFDEESYISTMESNSLVFADKLKLYINAKFRSNNKTFYFNECMKAIMCRNDTLRRLLRSPLFSDAIIKLKSSGKSTIYEVKTEV